MNLFDEESILLSNDNSTVILTTHRIRADFGNASEASLTSMMLENVSSVQLSSRSHPALLSFGVVGSLIGLGLAFYGERQFSSVGGLLLLLSIVSLVLYYYSRKHTCVIASNGGSRIVFTTTNMKREALIDFIDQVEQAKMDRLTRIRSV